MKKKILLIAGHGEGDPGAVSKWGQEADLARDLLKRIPKYLNVSVLNAELYDTAKDCYQQTKKGTGPDYGAYDFILEIHFNAKQKKDEEGDGSFTGTGGYVQKGADTEIAQAMIQELVALGFQKWCLYTTEELCNCNAAWRAKTPYFLLETAFLDDGDDMRFYSRHKEKIAKAIAEVLNEKVGGERQQDHPERGDHIYRVQCGAFLRRENAEAFKKQLEEAGFPTVIVVAKSQ